MAAGYVQIQTPTSEGNVMASSMSTAWTCQECRKPQRGAKRSTMTGRTICGPCERTQDARVFGMLSGGTVPEQMQNATAVQGARNWIRKALGKKD